MKNAEHVVALVREWVAKAENDLLTASHTLTLGTRCPTDTLCFHAQQAAEKYLKALLSGRGIEFPKTHDLVALAGRLRNGPRPILDGNDLVRLARYATVTRYPGAEPISLVEARRALAAARRVRKALRALLPRKTLRRKPAVR